MTLYRASFGEQSIVWGKPINIVERTSKSRADSIYVSHQGEWDWNLQPGVYYARDIVRELDTLLEVISIRLGDAADSEGLLLNIEASLAISGRESVLSLDSTNQELISRAEITAQASAIGQQLASWAREFNSQRWARSRYSQEALGSLLVRSRCDHHLWTPRVTDLLMGPLGGPAVMQLFNEYLHQIVLLRDALLPFDNWEEVPIELTVSSSGKGLRYTENARAQFLTELLVKQVSHKSIVRYAQAVLSPSLSPVGYGFQYSLGTVLPASLTSDLVSAPKYLLRWHPVHTTVSSTISTSSNASAASTVSAAQTAEASTAISVSTPVLTEQIVPVAFDYEFQDYYSAPRNHIGQGENEAATRSVPIANPNTPPLFSEAHLHTTDVAVDPHDSQSDRVHLQYRLRLHDTDITVDLGQVLRGHRFVYHTRPNLQPAPNSTTLQQPSQLAAHSAQEILQQPGLVTSDAGSHLIHSGGDPLIQRALLGKLYPENVILLKQLDEEQIAAAHHTGKGFGPRFLIY